MAYKKNIINLHDLAGFGTESSQENVTAWNLENKDSKSPIGVRMDFVQWLCMRLCSKDKWRLLDQEVDKNLQTNMTSQSATLDLLQAKTKH